MLSSVGSTTSSSAWTPADTRRCATSSCGERLRTPSIAWRLHARLFAEIDPAQSERQRCLDDTSRWYQPNWKVYRHNPARARRLLEQAGCRRGDGIYICGGQRLSLRFFAPGGRASGARPRASPGAAPTGRGRPRLKFSPARCSSTRSSRAAASTCALLTSQRPDPSAGSTAAEATRTHRLLPATCDRDLDRPNGYSTSEAGPRSEPGRRQMAKDVPVSRSTRFRSARIQDDGQGRRTGRSTCSGTRRTGGSTASPRRGDRRLAPRRLGSGRRGRADAEARRHACHRDARLASRRVSTCSSTRAPASTARPRTRRSSPVPSRSRRTPTFRPNLVSHVTSRRRRSRSSTTSVPRHAGATAFRSPRGTSSSRTRRSESTDCPRRSRPDRRPQRPRARREDGQGRPAGAARRTGATSSTSSCRGTRSPARTSRRSGRTRIDNPKTGRPIGSGPFLVRAGSAASN